MNKIAELKNIIKETSLKVRNLKNQRKTVNFVGKRTLTPYQAILSLNGERINLRRFHIAYGLLRGKTYEEIEQKVRDENELKEHDWELINYLIDKYKNVDIKEDNTSNE